jgi:hypothetical protein
MQIEEFSRFQLEATKLGRNVVFQMTVYRRKDSRNKKLFAETQCSDPLHFIIQFVIRDETTVEGIIGRFKSQLIHRGFLPLRVRMRDNGKWEGWQPMELTDEERSQIPD